MSVKLIVVALLAATAVAADATANNTVNVTICTTGTTCGCTNPTTLEYPTTCPEKAGEDNIFWKADSCDNNTDAFVVKGYSKAGCAAGEMKVTKACTAQYFRAECKDKTVNIYSGCSSDQCGADSCKSPISFAADACAEFTDGYYKVKGGVCPANGENLVLEAFADSKCTSSSGEVTYPTNCTVTQYQQGTCTPGDKGQVTISTCSDSTCSTCSTAGISLKTYTKLDDKIVYIESCKADDTEFTLQVYDRVQQYSKKCTFLYGASGQANATCVIPSKSGVIAPAHTVGVLALALCLLAYLY